MLQLKWVIVKLQFDLLVLLRNGLLSAFARTLRLQIPDDISILIRGKQSLARIQEHQSVPPRVSHDAAASDLDIERRHHQCASGLRKTLGRLICRVDRNIHFLSFPLGLDARSLPPCRACADRQPVRCARSMRVPTAPGKRTARFPGPATYSSTQSTLLKRGLCVDGSGSILFNQSGSCSISPFITVRVFSWKISILPYASPPDSLTRSVTPRRIRQRTPFFFATQAIAPDSQSAATAAYFSTRPGMSLATMSRSAETSRPRLDGMRVRLSAARTDPVRWNNGQLPPPVQTSAR